MVKKFQVFILCLTMIVGMASIMTVKAEAQPIINGKFTLQDIAMEKKTVSQGGCSTITINARVDGSVIENGFIEYKTPGGSFVQATFGLTEFNGFGECCKLQASLVCFEAGLYEVSDIYLEDGNGNSVLLTAEACDLTGADFSVKEITAISIVSPPSKTEYLTGQSLDLTGLVVNATYTDETTAELPITMDNINGFDSSVPATDQIVTITVKDKKITFTVNIIENSGDFEVVNGVLVKYKGVGGDVVIPEVYGIKSIGDGSFNFCYDLISVTMPKSVTSIGSDAFSSCINLKSITLKDGLHTIGHTAFNNCTALTEVTIPKSVYSLNLTAFSNCRGLTNIFIDDENSSYSDIDGVLYDKQIIALLKYPRAKDWTTFTIPNGILYIQSDAFQDCKNLYDVNIPNSVTSISFGAFYNCTNLLQISIPDSVTSISGGAFSNCTNLKSVRLSSNLNSIEQTVFNSCSSLAEITIPEGVKTIGNSAFSNCTSMSRAIIPDSVTKIDESAFWGCANLNDIIIPEGVTFIANSSFSGCTNLTKISLPSSLTSITMSAFTNCSSLQEITIPDNVHYIGKQAFQNCTSLTNITIPDSVTSIDNWAFGNCVKLTSITIPNSVRDITGDNVFNGCNNLSINGLPGSYTETYAKEHRIPFVDINTLFGIKSLTATPENSQYLNSAIQLAAEGQNGLAPYQYKFYYKQGTITTTIQDFSATATAVFKPAAAGTYIMTVEIKDADGKIATKSIAGYTVENIIGDVDGNGQVQAYDALTVLQIATGKKTVTPTELKAADVDGLGGVQAYDALRILQYATGKITEF